MGPWRGLPGLRVARGAFVDRNPAERPRGNIAHELLRVVKGAVSGSTAGATNLAAHVGGPG